MRRLIWPKRRSTRVLLLLVVILVGPYLFSRVASTWRRVRLGSDPSIRTTPSPQTASDSLRITCYNIAHGRGLAESNWKGGSREERRARLDRIAELLREFDADVVVLNEVDFDSSWSHGVNQAEYLARRAGYPYRAEERNLDFRFLIWTWRFGNAVLSRHPIEDARVVSFPGFASWETILAGKKRGLICTIDAPAGRFRILATHLSHRSELLRVESADMMIDLSRDGGSPLVMAGDFNSTPSGFPQSNTDDQGRNAIAQLDASGAVQRRPVESPGADEMTFHSNRPRSVIDWILIPKTWHFVEYRVILSGLSDHRPVVAKVDRGVLDPAER